MVCVHAAMRTTSSAPGRIWPANSRHLRHIRVASPSTRIQHLDTVHCSQQPPSGASQVGCIFGEKNCLSPPDVLPTSCRLPPSKGALPAYQDVLDALRNPLEHQGRRDSISRYLHFLEKIYRFFSPFFIYRIFLHFRRIFLHFYGEKSGLKDDISPFLWKKILPKSNIFLLFSGAISWLSGWIYAFDIR
jgi:hypothetical protein